MKSEPQVTSGPLTGTQYVNGRTRSSWWQRKSRKAKLLVIAALLTIVALAVGLGVGLGIGLRNRNEDNNADNGSNSEAPNANLTAIPATPSDNKNIYRPRAGTTWQIILLNPIDVSANATSITPDVEVYDIDLFTSPKATIDTLHQLGKKVICYFSAGSYEPGRPDSGAFKESDMGHELDGWPGERWLNLRSENVKTIMKQRIQLAADKGCDGVDPDNMDAYNNKNNGVSMTAQDSIDFMGYLSGIAASLNMAIGLKNAGSIIPQVLPGVQFAVNEQCVQYSECSTWDAFINADKPVFEIEYPSEVKTNFVANFCNTEGPANGRGNFSTVIKHMNLDGWVEYCGGMEAVTPTNTTSTGRSKGN